MAKRGKKPVNSSEIEEFSIEENEPSVSSKRKQTSKLKPSSKSGTASKPFDSTASRKVPVESSPRRHSPASEFSQSSAKPRRTSSFSKHQDSRKIIAKKAKNWEADSLRDSKKFDKRGKENRKADYSFDSSQRSNVSSKNKKEVAKTPVSLEPVRERRESDRETNAGKLPKQTRPKPFRESIFDDDIKSHKNAHSSELHPPSSASASSSSSSSVVEFKAGSKPPETKKKLFPKRYNIITGSYPRRLKKEVREREENLERERKLEQESSSGSGSEDEVKPQKAGKETKKSLPKAKIQVDKNFNENTKPPMDASSNPSVESSSSSSVVSFLPGSKPPKRKKKLFINRYNIITGSYPRRLKKEVLEREANLEQETNSDTDEDSLRDSNNSKSQKKKKNPRKPTNAAKPKSYLKKASITHKQAPQPKLVANDARVSASNTSRSSRASGLDGNAETPLEKTPSQESVPMENPMFNKIKKKTGSTSGRDPKGKAGKLQSWYIPPRAFKDSETSDEIKSQFLNDNPNRKIPPTSFYNKIDDDDYNALGEFGPKREPASISSTHDSSFNLDKPRVGCCYQLWRIKKTLIFIFTPLLLIPILVFWNSKQGRLVYVTVLMMIYWMTEVIPLAATSLLPVALFPTLGIMPTAQTCENYLKDSNMLYFGALLVALSFENTNLHKRLALSLLIVVGPKPKWIIFGFMFLTSFLSMWTSNVAISCIMIPVSQFLLNEIEKNRNFSNKKANRVVFKDDEEFWFQKFKTALKISIAFSCSLGGIASLRGASANILVKQILDDIYGTNTVSYDFWWMIGVPVLTVDLMLAWFIIVTLFLGIGRSFGCKTQNDPTTVRKVIKEEFAKLGSLKLGEFIVAFFFMALAVLKITRNPQFMPGWESLLKHEEERQVSQSTPGNGTQVAMQNVNTCFVTDTTLTFTIIFFLFILPIHRPRSACFGDKNNRKTQRPVLDWYRSCIQMPWGILILLGGGFALADAFESTKLSETILHKLLLLRSLPTLAINVTLCSITILATQLAPNSAVATIILPIIAQFSIQTCTNPFYYMMPVAMCTSFAFILPVGTPPNAIAFSYGDISICDMLKSGLPLILITLASAIIGMHSIGSLFFELNQWPDWAQQVNCSVVVP